MFLCVFLCVCLQLSMTLPLLLFLPLKSHLKSTSLPVSAIFSRSFSVKRLGVKYSSSTVFHLFKNSPLFKPSSESILIDLILGKGKCISLYRQTFPRLFSHLLHLNLPCPIVISLLMRFVLSPFSKITLFFKLSLMHAY